MAITTAILLLVGAVSANFLIQVMTRKKEWGKATEISAYQAAILGVYLFVS